MAIDIDVRVPKLIKDTLIIPFLASYHEISFERYAHLFSKNRFKVSLSRLQQVVSYLPLKGAAIPTFTPSIYTSSEHKYKAILTNALRTNLAALKGLACRKNSSGVNVPE
jgi:hypothetical protein